MKKLSMLFAFLLMAGTASGGQGIGLGVILGEPTGVSFKAWIDNRTAIDAAAAWSFSENDSFQFHTDYYHPLPCRSRRRSGRRLLLLRRRRQVKMKDSDGEEFTE
jgi:hypothetical protein